MPPRAAAPQHQPSQNGVFDDDFGSFTQTPMPAQQQQTVLAVAAAPADLMEQFMNSQVNIYQKESQQQ